MKKINQFLAVVLALFFLTDSSSFAESSSASPVERPVKKSRIPKFGERRTENKKKASPISDKQEAFAPLIGRHASPKHAESFPLISQEEKSDTRSYSPQPRVAASPMREEKAMPKQNKYEGLSHMFASPEESKKVSFKDSTNKEETPHKRFQSPEFRQKASPMLFKKKKSFEPLPSSSSDNIPLPSRKQGSLPLPRLPLPKPSRYASLSLPRAKHFASSSSDDSKMPSIPLPSKIPLPVPPLNNKGRLGDDLFKPRHKRLPRSAMSNSHQYKDREVFKHDLPLSGLNNASPKSPSRNAPEQSRDKESKFSTPLFKPNPPLERGKASGVEHRDSDKKLAFSPPHFNSAPKLSLKKPLRLKRSKTLSSDSDS